jgi:hypothetical protein
MSRFLGYWEKTREGGLLLFRCVVLLLSCVNFCLVHFLSRFNFFLAPRGRLALFLPPRGRRDIDIFASVEAWEYNYIHPFTILYLRAAFRPDSPYFHAVFCDQIVKFLLLFTATSQLISINFIIY